MKSHLRPRGAIAAALVSCYFLNVGCGKAPTSHTRESAPSPAQGSDARTRQEGYEPAAQLLANSLEADLMAQGLSAADARAIALGALEGSQPSAESRTAVDARALGLFDLKSFLPGFLRGALGVAKGLFAGTPLGVASTIVESVVKGFSHKPDAPKDVLASIPAIALDAILKKSGAAAPASATQPSMQEMLVALLASGRGISALPQLGGLDSEAGALISKQMMQQLVTALMKQPGANSGALSQLLPQLQDALQKRVVGSGALDPSAQLGAISEGQFAALLGLQAPTGERDALLKLLLQKGADTLLTKIGVTDDALRAKFLQAVAQGAARPVQDLKTLPIAEKHDLLQTLAQALTKSVLGLDDRLGPLKEQALEASLLGLSRGLVATKGVSQQELATAFANVASALSKGALAQPNASVDTRQMLLRALGQASVAAVDEAAVSLDAQKRALLESTLRALATGAKSATQAASPQGELIEALLAALAGKARPAQPPANVITEDDLLRILAQAG